MKCKNCNCQVSSDFKHSFATNCCPKCGNHIMTQEVKNLYLQMEEVLQKNSGDIGDLAVWFVETYFAVPSKEESDTSTNEQNVIDASSAENVVVKKPKPIKRIQDPQPIQNDRANLFTKRAGVTKLISQDKSKFENLVKDIQGSDDLSVDFENDPIEKSEDYSTTEDNYIPLSGRELNSMDNLFDTPTTTVDFNEIQRLQKLEQLSMTGSVGKIKRSS